MAFVIVNKAQSMQMNRVDSPPGNIFKVLFFNSFIWREYFLPLLATKNAKSVLLEYISLLFNKK